MSSSEKTVVDPQAELEEALACVVESERLEPVRMQPDPPPGTYTPGPRTRIIPWK